MHGAKSYEFVIREVLILKEYISEAELKKLINQLNLDETDGPLSKEEKGAEALNPDLEPEKRDGSIRVWNQKI